MTDKSSNKMPVWVIGLLIALLALVGVQSAWLYRISDHLNSVQPATTASEGSNQIERMQVADSDTTPLRPQAIPVDEWDPFQEMQRMREEMDRMFGNALGRFDPVPGLSPMVAEELMGGPKLNLTESEDDYTLEVDLSAMQNPKINTELSGRTLTIQASSDSEIHENGQGDRVVTQGRRSESFTRSILFDQPVQAEQMTQEIDHGILKIRVPKARA